MKDPRTDLCHTFVIAMSTRVPGNAIRMRSYGTPYSDAFIANIWDVARATTAVPNFFAPITIGKVLYESGGPVWNNPTKEAIAEARDIWGDTPIGVVVSIGDGLMNVSELHDPTQMSGYTDVNQKPVPLSEREFLLWEYAAMSSRCCESIHQEIVDQFNAEKKESRYFRLNITSGMSSTGLADWERVKEIRSLTNQYMSSRKLSTRKIAACLKAKHYYSEGFTPIQDLLLHHDRATVPYVGPIFFSSLHPAEDEKYLLFITEF